MKRASRSLALNLSTPRPNDLVGAASHLDKSKSIRGFTCSCFDLLHAGHIIMLREAKQQCDYLIVGLQTDPTVDRDDKNAPVQSLIDRYEQLNAVKYVDSIYIYQTEDDLYELLQRVNPDVRFIGTDWAGKEFTGHDLPIKIRYTNRYGHSTTELRNRICLAEMEKLATPNTVDQLKVQIATGEKNSGRHFVHKGWGYEDWLVNKEEYCGKILYVKQGKKFSWHYHKVKDETFYLHEGEVELTYGFSDDIASESTQMVKLCHGDTFHIPVGLRHQVRALEDSLIFEFSTTHFDEDSHRIIKGD